VESRGQDSTRSRAPDDGERPYDCRMPVRFLQMQSRDARSAALIAALLFLPLCAVPTAAARWSAPTRPAGCSAALPAAPAPSVVFPSAGPTMRSGPGALLWTAPRECTAGSSGATAGEAFGATLASDDLPGGGRALAGSAGGLAEVVTTAGTALGQVVAVGSAQSTATTGGGTGATPTVAGEGTSARQAAAAGSTGADTGLLAEGKTAGAFGAAQPLGGPAAPVAASSAYLGDVAIASPVRTKAGWAIAVRVQRHYSESPARPRLVPVGASPVEAVAATMDYRAEVLLMWASGRNVYARELSSTGALGPAQRLGSLSAGSPDLELRALISDDGHAIVAWRSQSMAPGGVPTTTVTLSISGSGLAFSAPRVLEHFRDLGGFVPPAGSLRLLRLSSEAVMIAWTGVDAGRYVVRASPVSLHRGAWAPVVISGLGSDGGQADANGAPAAGEQTGGNRVPASEGGQRAGDTPISEQAANHAPAAPNHAPATDAVLADLAAGPDAEAFALWRTAPSSSDGAPNSQRWAIRAARGHYAGQGEVSFAAPELVAPPGPNGPPAIAVDPTNGRALAAWVTPAGGGGIEYALRAAVPPTALAPATASVTHAARRATGRGGIALVVGLAVFGALALAGALLLGVPRRPGHMRARRG
jgi:hypothetical protein